MTNSKRVWWNTLLALASKIGWINGVFLVPWIVIRMHIWILPIMMHFYYHNMYNSSFIVNKYGLIWWQFLFQFIWLMSFFNHCYYRYYYIVYTTTIPWQKKATVRTRTMEFVYKQCLKSRVNRKILKKYFSDDVSDVILSYLGFVVYKK